MNFLDPAEQLCIRTPLIKLCKVNRALQKSNSDSQWIEKIDVMLFIAGFSISRKKLFHKLQCTRKTKVFFSWMHEYISACISKFSLQSDLNISTYIYESIFCNAIEIEWEYIVPTNLLPEHMLYIEICLTFIVLFDLHSIEYISTYICTSLYL